MALPFGYLLGNAFQGSQQYQAQQEALNRKRQQDAIAAWQFEQAKQQQAQQTQANQALLGALGTAMPPAAPQAPAPLPPMPGQASQPRAPVVAGGGTAPPTVASAAAARPAIPPYQTVASASAPPAPAAPQAPSAPPALGAPAPSAMGGMPDPFTLARSLSQQGYSPDVIMSALSKAQPFYEMANKNLAAQNKMLMDEIDARYKSAQTEKIQHDLTKPVAPPTRKVQQGTQEITQELQPDGTWKTIGKGPKFAKSIINIGGGGGSVSSVLDNPESAKTLYDIYKSTGKAPSFSWGSAGNADRQKWNAVVAKYAKEEGGGSQVAADQAVYKANQHALMQSTKDLAAIQPYKVMLDTNIDIAKKLGENIVRSNSALANKSLNWIKQNMGDNPDTSEYLAQMQIVTTESARVLNNPRLVGQLTDTARKEMEDIVNGNMPLQASVRVLDRIKQDGMNRVKAMEKQNEKIKSDLRGSPALSGAPASSQAMSLDAYLKSKGY